MRHFPGRGKHQPWLPRDERHRNLSPLASVARTRLAGRCAAHEHSRVERPQAAALVWHVWDDPGDGHPKLRRTRKGILCTSLLRYGTKLALLDLIRHIVRAFVISLLFELTQYFILCFNYSFSWIFSKNKISNTYQTCLLSSSKQRDMLLPTLSVWSNGLQIIDFMSKNSISF